MKTLLILICMAANMSAAVCVWDTLNFADDPWELSAGVEEISEEPRAASFDA